MFKPRVDIVGKELTIKIDLDDLKEAIDEYYTHKFAVDSIPKTQGNENALEFLKKNTLNDIMEGKIFAFQ